LELRDPPTIHEFLPIDLASARSNIYSACSALSFAGFKQIETCSLLLESSVSHGFPSLLTLYRLSQALFHEVPCWATSVLEFLNQGSEISSARSLVRVAAGVNTPRRVLPQMERTS